MESPRLRLPLAALILLPLSGCANRVETLTFQMPDGALAEVVTATGTGATPPVVAIVTPRSKAYQVQVVSSIPLAQAVLQGLAGGAAVGAGLALEGALTRPTKVNASGGTGNAEATGSGTATAISR